MEQGLQNEDFLLKSGYFSLSSDPSQFLRR